eukprot:1149971-Pelagomonas_calceolata.AAC.5
MTGGCRAKVVMVSPQLCLTSCCVPSHVWHPSQQACIMRWPVGAMVGKVQVLPSKGGGGGDFGLAVDMNQERPVTRLGTLDYMSPEASPYESILHWTYQHTLDYMSQHASAVGIGLGAQTKHSLLVHCSRFIGSKY